MAYIGKQPQIGNYIKLDAITTSATATYNLTAGGVAVYPQTATNCIVSLNGIIQAPTDAYTISGSQIIFASALTASDVIDFITVLGDVLNIGTPSDGTVGFSKVTSNLITGATAETSIDGADSILIYDDSATALRKMTRTNFVSGIGGANTPAFFALRSGNQTISNLTTTTMQFNNEIIDTAGCYDPTTNYRFTPTTSGKYFIFASIILQNFTADKVFFVSIVKNGSPVTNVANSSGSVTDDMSAYLGVIVEANGTTDYFTATVYQGSGGNSTMTTGAIFGGYKLIE